MVDSPDTWRVRISRGDDRVVGAGVLIDRWRVLTCAHVVAQAVGGDPAGGRPATTVTVEFLSATGAVRRGAVDPDGWVPVAADGRGDIALLVLDEPAPEGVRPASLAPCGQLDDRIIRAYGHPAGAYDGVWATTRLVRSGGPGGEWLQIDGETVPGRRVERGFSGAGAVDTRFGMVVGLVVAQDREAPHKVAWIMPMELVAKYLPVVDTVLRNPAVAPPAPAPAAAEPHERRLSPAEQDELFARLRAVPGMFERTARDLYLRSLNQRLGEPLRPERQREDALDLWALMEAALARPGALRTLVGVLRSLRYTSEAVDQLEEFVERTFPDLLLRDGERRELERLLAGISWGPVGAAFRAAVAGLILPPAIERSDTATVIRRLEPYGRLRGGPPPPLVIFVEELAHRIGGQTSVALHRWRDTVADRLGLSRSAVRQICEAADRHSVEGGAVHYLTILLDPDPVDLDRYLMAAWLQQEQQAEQLIQRDDVLRTLPEVVGRVEDLLRTVPETATAEIDELVVEFILPRRLLAHPVEEWLSEPDPAAQSLDLRPPLGLRHPVVVRSLERLQQRSMHLGWRRKSRRLADHGHRADPEAVHCVFEPGDPVQLYSAVTAEERIVCLAIPFPPDADPAHQGEFAAGLTAGLPAIIWSRIPVDAAEFCSLVRSVLTADGVLNLARRALWYRRDVRKTGETINPGRGRFMPPIGLLYDDATRIPGPFRRSVRLQAPQ